MPKKPEDNPFPCRKKTWESSTFSSHGFGLFVLIHSFVTCIAFEALPIGQFYLEISQKKLKRPKYKTLKVLATCQKTGEAIKIVKNQEDPNMKTKATVFNRIWFASRRFTKSISPKAWGVSIYRANWKPEIVKCFPEPRIWSFRSHIFLL